MLEVVQGCYRDVTGKLQGRYGDVTGVLQGCCRDGKDTLNLPFDIRESISPWLRIMEPARCGTAIQRPCYFILYYVMLHYGLLCCVMLCDAILCYDGAGEMRHCHPAALRHVML
jgi:hypothetical protein